MDDITELLNRISDYGDAYKSIRIKPPLFRITPYEYTIFTKYLTKNYLNWNPQYFGDLPEFMGINFELVGKPILLCGMHIRSDSGIELQTWKNKNDR